MEANPPAVCGKSRKTDDEAILKRVTTRGCGNVMRRRCRAIIIGAALQSLFAYGAVPGWAQSENPAGEVKRPVAGL